MEFIQHFFYLPQESDVILINLLLVIAQTIFLSYLLLQFGASSFATIYKGLGKYQGNNKLLKFSNDLHGLIFINKGVSLILATLAFVSIAIFYQSLLYGSSLNIISISVAVVVALIIANWFASSFAESVKVAEAKSEQSNSESSTVAAMFYFVAIVLYAGLTELVSNESLWKEGEGLAAVFESGAVWIKILLFWSISYAMTGGAILFFFFNDARINPGSEYGEIAGRRGTVIAYTNLLCIPILLLSYVLCLNEGALNFATYFFFFLSLGAIFGVFHMLNAIKNGSRTRFDRLILPVFILSIFLFTLGEKAVFDHGQRIHASKLKDKQLNSGGAHGDAGSHH